MTDFDHPRREDTMSRIGRYLKTRSGEVWAFFVAGLVIGVIIG